MIDWGATPKGSVASIYWPQVQASEVLMLASTLYPTHTLTAADNNTVQCKVTGGVTYIPIPMGSGENFAGLLTLDLPTTVVTGQEFNVVVRRVGRRLNRTIDIQALAPQEGEPNPVAVSSRRPGIWRYVIGTFQVKIPVTTSAVMLFPEENTLAIMKWRLQQTAPSSRWYAVLQRYVEYIRDRVAGLGGHPDAIPASPNGAPIKGLNPCEDVIEYSGKVVEVVFDCFGDFEGFVLAECYAVNSFKIRERQIGEIAVKACKDRLPLSVFAPRNDRSKIQRLVIKV